MKRIAKRIKPLAIEDCLAEDVEIGTRIRAFDWSGTQLGSIQNLPQSLQTLSHRLLEVQETERRSIARELHDEIGQVLTAVKINLQTMQRSSGNCPHLLLLNESIAIVDRALQQVRNLSLDLRPSMLDDLGLLAALRWYLGQQAKRAGFDGQFVADKLKIRPASDIETVCFRVGQEALTNVARHAQARRVRVEVRHRKGKLELLIQDDGVGFNVEAARKRAIRGACLGLLGMQERVQLVGGQIEIKSAPKRGTTILARFSIDTVM